MKASKQMEAVGKQLVNIFGKYKYVLLVILVGVILLLLPTFGEQKTAARTPAATTQDYFDVQVMERKLEEALSQVEGAGKVTVVLTLKSGTRQILAQDSKMSEKDGARDNEVSAVVISRGSGMQETVSVQEISPQFQGALVVCSGGNDPAVRLRLVEAVAALTGLGSDKISICKGK